MVIYNKIEKDNKKTIKLILKIYVLARMQESAAHRTDDGAMRSKGDIMKVVIRNWTAKWKEN